MVGGWVVHVDWGRTLEFRHISTSGTYAVVGGENDGIIQLQLQVQLHHGGILGTVLLAAFLLAVGIVATSVLSAILVGLLLFFLTLTFGGIACFVRCLLDCEA